MDNKFIIQTFTSWPVMGFILSLFIIILFYKPIKMMLNKTNLFKIGSFEFIVNEIGQSLGISNTITEINDLSYEEIKLFLITCGEDADYYIFSPENIPPDKLKTIYSKFNNKGLIELIDPRSIPNYETLSQSHGTAEYVIKTTIKGRNIHKTLIESIFHELTKTKLEKH